MISYGKETLAFLEDQILRLFLIRSCNATEKARQRSYCIGFSCLLIIILPYAYFYMFIEDATLVDYTIYGLLSMSSISGDYIFVDTKKYPKISHYIAFIDNWIATTAVGYNIFKFVRYANFPDIRSMICLALVFLTLPFLHVSRGIQSQKKWVISHTLWHLFAVGIALAVLEVQRYAQI